MKSFCFFSTTLTTIGDGDSAPTDSTMQLDTVGYPNEEVGADVGW